MSISVDDRVEATTIIMDNGSVVLNPGDQGTVTTSFEVKGKDGAYVVYWDKLRRQLPVCRREIRKIKKRGR